MLEEAGKMAQNRDEAWGHLMASMEHMAKQVDDIAKQVGEINSRLIQLESRDLQLQVTNLKADVAKLLAGEIARKAQLSFAERLPHYVAYFATAVAIVLALNTKLGFW